VTRGTTALPPKEKNISADVAAWQTFCVMLGAMERLPPAGPPKAHAEILRRRRGNG
jgi:hypothetical protein